MFAPALLQQPVRLSWHRSLPSAEASTSGSLGPLQLASRTTTVSGRSRCHGRSQPHSRGSDLPRSRTRQIATAALFGSGHACFAAIMAKAAAPAAKDSIITHLPAVGTFVLSIATSLFLLAAIPTLWALALAAYRTARVLAVVEKELPDTMATMRLSGMEMSDCIQELGALGGELSKGVRSTAQLATMAEQGVKVTLAVADGTMQHKVKPALAKTEHHARGLLERQLQAASQLQHTKPIIRQVGAAAASTAGIARKVRAGMLVANLANVAIAAGRSTNEMLRQAAESNSTAHQSAEAGARMPGPPQRPSVGSSTDEA